MTNEELYSEIDNLERELSYYIGFEPKNKKAISAIENRIAKLVSKLSKSKT